MRPKLQTQKNIAAAEDKVYFDIFIEGSEVRREIVETSTRYNGKKNGSLYRIG
jgi:hypothetical protein